MKNKKLLSLCALAGVLNFSGCSDNLEGRLGSDIPSIEGLPAQSATLIRKDDLSQRGGPYYMLFFDLDGFCEIRLFNK